MSDIHNVQFEDLSAYIDGRLSETEQTHLEEHLQSCRECRSELEELRATLALLQALPAIQPPRSFTLDRNDPRLADMRARRNWIPALRWAAAAFSLLLVLTVGLDLSRSIGSGGAASMATGAGTAGGGAVPAAGSARQVPEAQTGAGGGQAASGEPGPTTAAAGSQPQAAQQDGAPPPAPMGAPAATSMPAATAAAPSEPDPGNQVGVPDNQLQLTPAPDMSISADASAPTPDAGLKLPDPRATEAAGAAAPNTEPHALHPPEVLAPYAVPAPEAPATERDSGAADTRPLAGEARDQAAEQEALDTQRERRALREEPRSWLRVAEMVLGALVLLTFLALAVLSRRSRS